MKRWILSSLVLLTASAGFTAELPRFYKGIRPLGMGGAFIAVSDDENALMYNPAGLDKVKTTHVGILTPQIEINENGRGLYGDINDTDMNDTAEVIELMRDYVGDYVHARVSEYLYFCRPNFAIGGLAQTDVNIRVNDMAYPIAEADAFGNLSGNVGLGFGFLEGHMLRVGAAARFIKGYRLSESYTAVDISDPNFDETIKDDLKEGTGFGFDAGAMVEFPTVLKPTLALVVQNISDVDLGDAGIIPQQINLGLSVTQTFFSDWLTLIGAADWVDVTKNVGEDEDLYKRLHFGLEARLPKMLSVRTGLYQGYGTFGATLDLGILQLDYATYAEEMGAYAGQTADRRHVVQVALGW